MRTMLYYFHHLHVKKKDGYKRECTKDVQEVLMKRRFDTDSATVTASYSKLQVADYKL
ncbi:hypothetical protein BDF14DRAFT_1800782 [Spinellus fusiger]|nr:hypothetical protein BDF14DRAFT_1800782 [Spinellus fusiger]